MKGTPEDIRRPNRLLCASVQSADAFRGSGGLAGPVLCTYGLVCHADGTRATAVVSLNHYSGNDLAATVDGHVQVLAPGH